MLTPSTLIKKAQNCLRQNKFMEIFNKAQAYSLNIIYSCIRARTKLIIMKFDHLFDFIKFKYASNFLSRHRSAETLCWLWYVVVVSLHIHEIQCACAWIKNGVYKFQQDKARYIMSLRSIEMVNKIRRVPLRTKGLSVAFPAKWPWWSAPYPAPWPARAGSAMPGTASKHSKPSS